MMQRVPAKDQLTKILVKRDEQSLFRYRPGKDRVVRYSGRIGTYPNNIVAAGAKRRNCVTRYVLIQKNAHG